MAPQVLRVEVVIQDADVIVGPAWLDKVRGSVSQARVQSHKFESRLCQNLRGRGSYRKSRHQEMINSKEAACGAYLRSNAGCRLASNIIVPSRRFR